MVSLNKTEIKKYVKAVEKGIIGGGSDGLFHPDQIITRIQFVVLLYKFCGSPKTTATTPFTDISTQSQEFKTALAWAYEHKYISGASATTFNPYGSLTREEAFTLLFNYSGAKNGNEIMFQSIYDGTFKDFKTVSSWAKNAMTWAIGNGIVTGTTATTLSPKQQTTRAEMAVLLSKYFNN